MDILVAALGGNKSAPTCSGSRAFNGEIAFMKNILVKSLNTVDTMYQLDKCSSEIAASCGFPVSEAEMTALEQCHDDATQYLDKLDNCLNPQFIAQQGCACFAAIQVGDLLDKVVACDTKKANDLIKTEKKKCIKSKLDIYLKISIILLSIEFASCKSAQDDTITLVDTCKKKIKCGGASDKADAEKQLKVLTP